MRRLGCFDSCALAEQSEISAQKGEGLTWKNLKEMEVHLARPARNDTVATAGASWVS